MSFDPGNRLVIALDVENRDRVEALVRRLGRDAEWLKIGLELFVAAGPRLVRELSERGFRIMLDLKLHDIPATVARAVTQATRLGAELATVHTGGGRAMLEAAAQAAAAAPGRPLALLGVTVLTSLDDSDLDEIGCRASAEELVHRRARMALEAGLDGVVASPREAARLRAAVPADFLIVTPGVRPAGAAVGDQKRITTPRQARAAGADLVVVGRPIRDAPDPGAAAHAIAAELSAAG